MTQKNHYINEPSANWPHCAPLMCSLNNIKSGYVPGVVLIDVKPYHCPDMSGTIKVCELLWPGCHDIRVSAGGVPDIRYFKKDGKWGAFEFRYVERSEQ